MWLILYGAVHNNIIRSVVADGQFVLAFLVDLKSAIDFPAGAVYRIEQAIRSDEAEIQIGC